METKHFNASTAAEAFLALLRDRGIDRVFTNGGTDFASFVEAYARAEESGLEFPEVIVCPHENLAISMAHGAYLASGRAQVVMLHTSVGTANSICGILNAARDRAPIFLAAGRTPLYEHGQFGHRNGLIHWAQEMYDQGGMLREFVKWDYEYRDAGQTEEVVDRALSLAMSDPRGPTYLTLPREVLAKQIDGFGANNVPPATPSSPFPDPSAIDALVARLEQAAFPVIVTCASGLDRSTIPILSDLAQRFAIGVVEKSARQMNLPADHPLHLGYQMGAVLGEADVVICLDVDVPWSPGDEEPRADAFVAQCGVDPLFARYPIRGHRSDLSITGSSVAILESLRTRLAEKTVLDERRLERLTRFGAARRAELAASLDAESRRDGPITKLFLNWALAQARPAEAIVVNEYWARMDVLAPTHAGTWIDTPPSGGLGWGVPAAMGIQLLEPDAPVIAAVGDGSYIFSNPAACHQAMTANQLPVLTVIANNGRWNAVEASAIGMYPEGFAAHTAGSSPFATLEPAPRYEQYAIASGGYGEMVSERSELLPALERSLKAIGAERRHAVLNVICQ